MQYDVNNLDDSLSLVPTPPIVTLAINLTLWELLSPPLTPPSPFYQSWDSLAQIQFSYNYEFRVINNQAPAPVEKAHEACFIEYCL